MHLSEFLKRRGLSDTAASSLFGVHRSQISRYRRNVAVPSLKTALAIKHLSDGAVQLDDWNWSLLNDNPGEAA